MGAGLHPSEFGLPKGPKNGIAKIATGADHCFAISKNGNVYARGLNNMGETGIMDNAGDDDASIKPAQVVEALKGKNIVDIKGGGHHSIAATEEGDCYVWGRMDGGQMGIEEETLAKLPEADIIRDERGNRRILKVPQKVSAIKGPVVQVGAASDHCFAVTKEGKAWSWGFSTNYQTGQGTTEDVEVAAMVDNTAVRERHIMAATCGGQYGIITSVAS